MTWSGQKVRYIWISTSQPRPGHQTHPQVGLAVAVLPLGVNLALDQHHRPPLPTASSAWQWGVRSLSWPLGCQTPTMSLMDLRTLPLPPKWTSPLRPFLSLPLDRLTQTWSCPQSCEEKGWAAPWKQSRLEPATHHHSHCRHGAPGTHRLDTGTGGGHTPAPCPDIYIATTPGNL